MDRGDGHAVSSQRSLLRFEDKVRSETRRLARVGEPPTARVASFAWLLAVGVHAAALGLPFVRSEDDVPLRSPRPDLPTVWRLTPPRPAEPVVSRAGARVPALAPMSVSTTVPRMARFDAEPVPEPPPILSIGTALPTEVDALIPDLDLTAGGLESAQVPRSVVTSAPRLLRQVRPTYPAAARALSASGSVTLEVWIREDGTVEFARVVTCSRPGLGFEESALLAVREWLYDASPAGTGSRTVTVRTEFQRDERRP